MKLSDGIKKETLRLASHIRGDSGLPYLQFKSQPVQTTVHLPIISSIYLILNSDNHIYEFCRNVILTNYDSTGFFKAPIISAVTTAPITIDKMYNQALPSTNGMTKMPP